MSKWRLKVGVPQESGEVWEEPSPRKPSRRQRAEGFAKLAVLRGLMGVPGSPRKPPTNFFSTALPGSSRRLCKPHVSQTVHQGPGKGYFWVFEAILGCLLDRRDLCTDLGHINPRRCMRQKECSMVPRDMVHTCDTNLASVFPHIIGKFCPLEAHFLTPKVVTVIFVFLF